MIEYAAMLLELSHSEDRRFASPFWVTGKSGQALDNRDRERLAAAANDLLVEFDRRSDFEAGIELRAVYDE